MSYVFPVDSNLTLNQFYTSFLSGLIFQQRFPGLFLLIILQELHMQATNEESVSRCKGNRSNFPSVEGFEIREDIHHHKLGRQVDRKKMWLNSSEDREKIWKQCNQCFVIVLEFQYSTTQKPSIVIYHILLILR